MDQICTYKRCNRSVATDENIKLFPFPIEEKWCKFWLNCCRRTDLNNVDYLELHENYRICDLHFNSSDFLNESRTQLKSMAFPKSSNDMKGFFRERIVKHYKNKCPQPKQPNLLSGDLNYIVVVDDKERSDNQDSMIRVADGNAVKPQFKKCIPTDARIAAKSKIYVTKNNTIYVVAPDSVPDYTPIDKDVQDLLDVLGDDPIVETPEESSTVPPPIKLNNQSITHTIVEPNKKLLGYEILHCIFNSSNNEKFCRICLLKTEDYIELFPDDLAKQNEIIEFKKILNDLFDINYELYDKPVICKKCYEHVIISFELKQKVLINEPELRRILTNYRPKPKTVEDSRIEAELDNIERAIIKETQKRLHPQYLSKQDFNFIQSLKNNSNLFDPKYNNYFSDVRKSYSPRLLKKIRNIYTDRTYQGPKPWLCDICGKYYNLESHRYSHCITKSKTYICEICGLTKPNYNSFLYHKYTKHQCYNCKHCKEELPNYSKFTAHMRQKHSDKMSQYQCDECGKYLLSKNTLRYHKRGHLREAGLKCKLCPKRFRNKFGLIKHLKNEHQKEPMNSCTFCERRFWSSEKLKDHIKNIHNEEIKITEEIPVIKDDIGENLDTDTEEPPVLPEDGGELPPVEQFECEVCHKIFYRKMHLDKHMRIHREANTVYSCPVCASDKKSRKSTIKSRSSLERHMRIFHSNDSHNKCVVCLKAFWKFCDLREHMKRKHDLHVNNHKEMREIDPEHLNKLRENYQPCEEQPENYTCTICGKEFKYKGGLKQHSRVHDRDENQDYSCQLCKASGKIRSKILNKKSLEKHMKIFHAEQPLNQCAICGRGYWNLKLHMKREHSIDKGEESLQIQESTLGDKSEIILEECEENDEEEEITELQHVYIKNEDMQVVDDENLQNVREVIIDDQVYYIPLDQIELLEEEGVATVQEFYHEEDHQYL